MSDIGVGPNGYDDGSTPTEEISIVDLSRGDTAPEAAEGEVPPPPG